MPPTPLQPPLVSQPSVLSSYERILSGYHHHDLPDFSHRRFAPDALRSISQPLASSFATIIAAVGRVLGAYSSCQDVLLGIVDGLEDELLPVRVAWSDSQTWEDVVSDISQTLSDPQRPQVHHDLLRQVLGLAPRQSPVLALVTAGPLPRPHDHIPTVFINYHSGVLTITSSERSFHPSQISLLASQIAALTSRAIADPKSSFAQIPPLAPDLLSSYKNPSEKRSNTSYLVPPVRLATDYLTLQAQEHPDAIAVRWYSDLSTDSLIISHVPETITNAELDKKANQLGRWLIQIGLQKGRSVAVCMKRNILFHVALIGILRAGGCYVPIDAELPVERQQFIVRDADVQYILSTSDMACFSSLGSITIDVIDLAIQDAIGVLSGDALMVPEREDVSYILYTSGTTGTPKGCILTHEGLSEAIWALSQFCASAELDPSGRVNYLSIASVAFDVHIAEVMVALAVGIPILSAPRALLLEDLPYYIKHLRVSHVGIVPSLIEATMGLVENDEESGNMTTLRYLASGGEKMSNLILDKWADHPRVRLANFYGPSEVTIGCAARMMDKDTPRANIGHTFDNVAAYVVDENMNIVLRGGCGELVVEGPLVGRGYVNRPDLTQKVFLRFPDDGTERWAYRTGDLVRMMADGTLEIIGRIDTQIKLRGVRIESEGISSILRNAAAPTHNLDVITVLAKHPAIGIDQIISFIAEDTSVPVAVRKGGQPSLASPPIHLLQELRTACDRGLASYMRPSHIIPLDFIPLSSNGKADAKVLAALFVGLSMESLTSLMNGESINITDDRRDHLVPSETEKKVFELLASYIKLPAQRLGSRTNLFECGMDSLAIVRFAGDLRRVFGAKVSPAQIMQAPTVNQIANLLGVKRAIGVPEEASSAVDRFACAVHEELNIAYPSDSIAAILPPFPVQEGVLYRSANAPTMYVQHVLMQLASHVSVSGLRDAWRRLVSQNEILRTVFHFGSALVQVILRQEACSTEVLEKNISDQEYTDFKRYFAEHESSSIAREINAGISNVPPLRLSFYIHSTSATPYLVLSIHHALFDGISLPVLLRNLDSMYVHQPQSPTVPLRTIMDHIAFIDDDDARAFWTSYLKAFPWRHLLNRSASSSVPDIASHSFTRPLSELQVLAAGRQVTLQALFMCAYGSLLAQYMYGHHDVVFGVIRTGRSIPLDNVETAICPMITVVPARVRLTNASDTLQAVQQDIARVGQFEHVPLGRIQKWIPGCTGTLFDTLFSVSYKEKETSQLWSVLESQNPEPDFILAVEIVLDPTQDNAEIRAAFTSADISPTLVDNILRNIEETAICMIEGGGNRLPLARDLSISQAQTPTTSSMSADVDVPDVDERLLSRISGIASQFLRVKPSYVMPGSSLISLGLDSIKSVGLSRKFAREGLGISSADIMRLATPHRLAAFIQRAGDRSAQDEARLSDATFTTACDRLQEALHIPSVKLSEDDDVQVFPTSVLQAGMLSQTITSSGRLYVHLFPLRLARDIDIERLQDSWKRAILSFDILRTSFHFIPSLGTWAQAVHSTPDFPWTESQYDVNANFADLLNPFPAMIDEHEPFKNPPIFLHLLKAADANDIHRLVLVLHHAVYDGLSIARLLRAVEDAYRCSEIASYAQFHKLLPWLLYQEDHGTTFWVDYLHGLHYSPIPRKRAALADVSVHQVSRPVRLTEEEIRKACRDSEVTPQCLGQTAFAKLMAILTQRRDVVFGRVVSGRDGPGAEDVIGPMLNTVPCRVVFGDRVRNRTLLKVVHDANIASMPWQHASIRSIQQELRLSTLWDSIYVFQPRHESYPQTDGAPWVFDADGGDVEDISIQYPLNIELHEVDGGFVVKAACKSDIASNVELQSMIELYATILCDVVRRPDTLWSGGLPDIPQSMSPTNDGPASDPSGENDCQGWDNSFNTFRETLSAATNVAPSDIHASTYLAALGVDSITAVQIAAKTRRIGLRLTAAEIVQSRMVGDLLKRMIKDVKTSITNDATDDTSINIPRSRWTAFVPVHEVDEIETVVHASAGMEWMVGMWQKSEGSRFQHVFGYRLPIDVDPSKLEDAWNALVRRHAVLRSSLAYDVEAGVPRVIIYKPETHSRSWSRESLESSEDARVVAERRMKELMQHPPTIHHPFTQAVLLRSSQATFLLLHLHHFQYDAWSLRLLIDDLSRIYAGEEPRSSNDLRGFLRFVCPTLQAEEEQARYWKSAFHTPHLFPTIRKGQAQQGRALYMDPAALVSAAKLAQRARELAVSLQSVFLACWAQVQARNAATDDATFSLWHSGRTGDLRDMERIAVPCINALPFSVLDAKTADTIELARRIQDDLQARSPIVEQTRLVKIHEWLGVRDRPLSNVFVNIVKIAPDLENRTDALLEPLDVPYHIVAVSPHQNTSIKDISVTSLLQDDIMVEMVVVQETDQVLMSIEYTRTIMDENHAKRLLQEWGTLVNVSLDKKA